MAKYAGASGATVRVSRENGRARVEVGDDGVGGADPAAGSGLRGLTDRVEALGGTLSIESPAGGGTRVSAEIPLQIRLRNGVGRRPHSGTPASRIGRGSTRGVGLCGQRTRQGGTKCTPPTESISPTAGTTASTSPSGGRLRTTASRSRCCTWQRLVVRARRRALARPRRLLPPVRLRRPPQPRAAGGRRVVSSMLGGAPNRPRLRE